MEQALYHPAHGYYSSGRCAIGRRGDYFTSVSVGPLFGKLLAAQFAEIWESWAGLTISRSSSKERIMGNLRATCSEALRERWPEFFATLRYRIVEPFPILQKRQEEALRPLRGKMEWAQSIDGMEPFCGVHFSNELLDAMPVHLLVAPDGTMAGALRRSIIVRFQLLSIGRYRCRLLSKLPSAPADGLYETEVNLAALDWIEALAPKLQQGLILAADYGFNREALLCSRAAAPARCNVMQNIACCRRLWRTWASAI